MKTFIARKILAPLGARLGTALAAFLGGTLVADPLLVDQFAVAVTAIVAIGADLIISHFERKEGR